MTTDPVIGRPADFWRYDRDIKWRALALAAFIAGCGNHDVVVAPDCTEGVRPITDALAHAPGDVRIRGSVRISDCFQPAASPADVQTLGALFIEVTQGLADRVRRAPRSRSAVQLGFLVGAVRRGAHTGVGVHYETERRIEQELVGLPTGTPQFRQGLAAGLRSG
jgi:hypothetical protein